MKYKKPILFGLSSMTSAVTGVRQEQDPVLLELLRMPAKTAQAQRLARQALY
jgi:hypothetical protein